MSTKRQPQANEESYAALQALFLKIAEGDMRLMDCDHVWRQVLDNRWFQTEVRIQAARLVGGDVDESLFDDMVQEVVLQLRDKLSKHGDLGGHAAQLRTNFPGWMARIIRNACIDTLRRERRHPHPAVRESDAANDAAFQQDLRLDVAEAISHLEPHEQQVAQFKLENFTIRETAEVLAMSERQVESLLKKTQKLLQRLLAAYRNDFKTR